MTAPRRGLSSVADSPWPPAPRSHRWAPLVSMAVTIVGWRGWRRRSGSSGLALAGRTGGSPGGDSTFHHHCCVRLLLACEYLDVSGGAAPSRRNHDGHLAHWARHLAEGTRGPWCRSGTTRLPCELADLPADGDAGGAPRNFTEVLRRSASPLFWSLRAGPVHSISAAACPGFKR